MTSFPHPIGGSTLAQSQPEHKRKRAAIDRNPLSRFRTEADLLLLRSFLRLGAAIGLGLHLALVILALGDPCAVGGAAFATCLRLDRLASRGRLLLLDHLCLLGRIHLLFLSGSPE